MLCETDSEENVNIVVSLFRKYLSWNQFEFPSPKDVLCQVWLKLAQWFWKRKFLKFRECIFASWTENGSEENFNIVVSLFRKYLP